MKICLFGATGLLGSEFKRIFIEQNINFIAPRSGEVSLLNYAKTLDYLKTEKPTLIVNCAAYTAVDKAEKETDICMKLNAGAVENLVKAGTPIINFSTEYVFNVPLQPSPNPSQREGSKSEYFEIPEDYEREPQSVYGQSKAAAEEALEASSIDWWNIRTSWLHGRNGNDFVSTITRLSQKYDELKIIDDQIGRPTHAPELAEFVAEHFIKTTQPKGHYHLQNSGEPVSWAGFAQYFLNQEGWHGTVKKITTEEYGAPAARPKNSVLKNTKLKTGLGDWKNQF